MIASGAAKPSQLADLTLSYELADEQMIPIKMREMGADAALVAEMVDETGARVKGMRAGAEAVTKFLRAPGDHKYMAFDRGVKATAAILKHGTLYVDGFTYAVETALQRGSVDNIIGYCAGVRFGPHG